MVEAPVVLAKDAPSAVPFERHRFGRDRTEEKRKRKVWVADKRAPL
jgi:hypothetical protein